MLDTRAPARQSDVDHGPPAPAAGPENEETPPREARDRVRTSFAAFDMPYVTCGTWSLGESNP